MKTKIFLMVLVLACAGCSTQGMGNLSFSDLSVNFSELNSNLKKVQTSTKEFTEAEEIELGQEIASNLLGAMPLLQNPKAQQYVNQIGRWLASQTERPGLPWKFAITDDNSLNAFAAPGGYIFITSGLLRQMKSEAELAGVLSHEISHVVKKHHLQAIRKAAQTGLLKEGGSFLVQKKANSTLASSAAKAAIGGFAEVYSKGLDKTDEFEADRMGVVIAARGGYDPYGLPAVLQTLGTFSPQDSNFALMFQTHPAVVERLSLLEKIMSPALDSFEKQPTLETRFKTAMRIAPVKK